MKRTGCTMLQIGETLAPRASAKVPNTRRLNASQARAWSSTARIRTFGGERCAIEERVLGDGLHGLIQSWFSRSEFERLQCGELLFV